MGERKHTGICYDCGGSLELFEFDIKKDTKIMKCQNCGLFHYYKKDLLGSGNSSKSPKTRAKLVVSRYFFLEFHYDSRS